MDELFQELIITLFKGNQFLAIQGDNTWLI